MPAAVMSSVDIGVIENDSLSRMPVIALPPHHQPDQLAILHLNAKVIAQHSLEIAAVRLQLDAWLKARKQSDNNARAAHELR